MTAYNASLNAGNANHGPKLNDAFVPLLFQAGDACQFDWSQEQVEIGGVLQKIKVAHFRLSYSRQMFVVAYPRETQEMVLDAHNRAFNSLVVSLLDSSTITLKPSLMRFTQVKHANSIVAFSHWPITIYLNAWPVHQPSRVNNLL